MLRREVITDPQQIDPDEVDLTPLSHKVAFAVGVGAFAASPLWLLFPAACGWYNWVVW